MSDEFENKDNDEVRKVSDEISNRSSAEEPAGEPTHGDAGGYNNEGYNNGYNNNGYGNNGNNNGYNNNNYNNGYNNSYNNNGYNNNSYNNGYNNPYPGNGSNNDGSNENGGNGKKNKNRGPILGLIAAVLALALIIGGLYAAVEFSGAGKQAGKKSDQTVALTKDKEEETESADKENTDKETAAVADKTDTKETDDAKLTTAVLNPDKVETTGKVQATALDVSAVVEEVMPSIVAVTNTTIYSSNGSSWGWYIGGGTGQDYSSKGAGSGVIIAQTDEEVMVATNAHVVVPEDYSKYGYTAESSEYEIQFCNNTSFKAYLKGYDSEADVAVLTVKLSDIDKDTLNEIKIATVGDSTKLKVGNGAIVIGNALGYGQSVTVGCISALERDVRVESGTKKLIQTDAAINPGNSGGGLFDTNGFLIGISEGKYSSTQVEGMCFAIPISSVESILTDIMNNNVKVREKVTDESKKAFLAIGTDKQYSQAYDGKGAFVYSVKEGGAADRAGIMAYDIITAINGVQIKNWNDLLEEMSYYEGGETVTITYYTFSEKGHIREYVEKTVDVTLDFKADYVDENGETK